MPGFKEPNAISTNQMGQGELDETKTIHQLDAKKRTLILPIDNPELSQLPAQTEIDGNEYTRKPEFHITAVSFAKAKEIKAALKERPELEAELNKIIADIDWKQLTINPEIYQIKEDKEITRQLSKKEKKALRAEGKEAPDSITEIIHREAIIQLADLPAIQEFYEKAKTLGIDLGEVPPVHITLYTHGDPLGIAINSAQDLEALEPKKIDINL